MPTNKSRFLVTIEPAHHLALKVLAKQRGKSVSAVINEMLAPALAPLLALVKASWDPAQTDLVDYLERLEEKLDATLKETSDSLLERGGRASANAGSGREPVPLPGSPDSLHGAGEGGGGRASIPRSARTSPPSEALPASFLTPSSNTGVTLPRSGGNQRVSKPGRKGSSR
jgi:hypothetical protein